jgi:hypothetical protein
MKKVTVRLWSPVNDGSFVKSCSLPLQPFIGLTLKVKIGKDFYLATCDGVEVCDGSNVITAHFNFENETATGTKLARKIHASLKKDKLWRPAMTAASL